MTTAAISNLSFKVFVTVLLCLIGSVATAAPDTVLSAVEQGLASGQFSKDDLLLLTQIQNTKSFNTVIYCGIFLMFCFLIGGCLSEKTGAVGATLLTVIVFGAGCVGITALEEAEANARMTPQLVLAEQAIRADEAKKKNDINSAVQSEGKQELMAEKAPEMANTETVKTESEQSVQQQSEVSEEQAVSNEYLDYWRGWLFVGLLIGATIAIFTGMATESALSFLVFAIWGSIAIFVLIFGSVAAIYWTIGVGVAIFVFGPFAAYLVMRGLNSNREHKDTEKQLAAEVEKTNADAEVLQEELALLKISKASLKDKNEKLQQQNLALTAQMSEQFGKQKASLEKTIQALENEIRTLKRQAAKENFEQSDNDPQLVSLQTSLAAVQNLNDSLTDNNKELEKKVRKLQSEARNTEREQERLLEYIEEKSEDNLELRRQNRSLLAENEKLKKFLTKEGLDELNWRLSTVEAQLTNSEKERALLRGENKELFQKYTALQTKIEVGRQLGETRKNMSVKSSPSLENVLSLLGSVPVENRKNAWETTAGRIEINGKHFFSYDNPKLSGAGALQLVRKTMNTSFIRAVMIIKASLGMGPALGAMEEFLDLYRDKLPDITMPVLIERAPIGDKEES